MHFVRVSILTYLIMRIKLCFKLLSAWVQDHCRTCSLLYLLSCGILADSSSLCWDTRLISEVNSDQKTYGVEFITFFKATSVSSAIPSKLRICRASHWITGSTTVHQGSANCSNWKSRSIFNVFATGNLLLSYKTINRWLYEHTCNRKGEESWFVVWAYLSHYTIQRPVVAINWCIYCLSK